MVSREHPLITINAMVKVGAWTIGPIHYGSTRKCDRCGTSHNYVWVCTIGDEVDDATVEAKLHGKRVWQVGSKCGPTLEMVSDAKWSGPPKDLEKMIKLAVKAVQVLADARAAGIRDLCLAWIEERLATLQRGELSPHLRRVLSSHVRSVRSRLDAIAAEAVKAAAVR
jgi:hypothetical protein